MPREPEEPQTKEIYLCVVSEWRGGRNSGNCYPLIAAGQHKVLRDPESEFPNAGAIFLPSRGDYKVFDFILVRPILNRTYADKDYRDCYFVPQPNWTHPPDREEVDGIHSVLAVPSFDADIHVIAAPAQMVTPVFFVRDLSRENRLLGPLRRLEVRRGNTNEHLESIVWKAASPDGLAWSLPATALETNGLKLEAYHHPHGELNEVLRRPYEFILGKLDSRLEGAEPIDLAAEGDLIRFHLRTAGGVLPEETIRALEELPSRPGTEAPAFLRSRFDRLARLLRVARELEGERRRLAGEFLATEEGRREVAAAIAGAKAEARAEVRAELDIEKERRRLQAELRALEERKASLEQELKAQEERHEEEAQGLRKLIAELTRTLAEKGEDLERRVFAQIPGLLAFARARPAGAGADVSLSGAEGSAASPRAPLRIEPVPPPRPFQNVEEESLYVRWLREELARSGLHFSLEMVANVFACLKCSSLTLLGGPPGVGKSSLVRGLASLLGQEHCFLELSVRRTWADDRALLGFPDTFHRRYEPGTTGFVPHLVRAGKDLDLKLGGIYLTLLDEFNLAPPEYYFSEFLRLLQKNPAERVLRLYTPGTAIADDPIPSEVLVGPNVSFWGTVNLDETTEALSPRLLDRVHFVIVSGEDLEKESARGAEKKPAASVPLGPLSYEQLARARARDAQPNQEAAAHVQRALAILEEDRNDWGPRVTFYPRQQREVDRYLAAARPVLSATVAADLVINQRVLPGLRGRGEAFRRRMEALLANLENASLERSASRLERIIRHAEENYDAFDFHVY